ncbi:pyridine nucleotide-disulfide oxidoreductase [Colletotrichum karsti]|uniref:Pyridine nucleotide-disulfide oxidoreductase n=1 Tax=Colletotrichum karsti TaxID=1095194 RepID=A0A9P6I113_9PEZI|nr:pyridine nucleotide-disulfide oxidoreductase [Colletotrichum karsti]KAF9872046.1 pyridine nucleotide-disulfide oxidoreductase [Colletotrichum karsti]
MAPLNILIVGCSIAGPTLATFLLLAPTRSSEKPHITILERAPVFRPQGQNIDVRGAGVTIIRKLGLEAAIRAATTGEEGVQFVDKDNQIWGSFGADKSGKVQTPTSDIEILRGRMADLLYGRSQEVSKQVQDDGGAGIEYIFGDSLDELEQDGDKVHVHFSKSGERRTFDLVVGADGLQSRTRSLAWGEDGEKDRVKRLDMYGGFFSMPRGPTDSEWRRWFHAEGRRGIMIRPSGLKDRTTVFMAVVNGQDERLRAVAERKGGSTAAQKAILKEYFQGLGWETDRIIKEMMATEDFYYDTISQIKMGKWSKGRVVLLGDAGYCASPLSGMGTTLALNGAYNLAGAITRSPNDLQTAFEEYEESMRATVDKAQRLAPGMPHSLHPETAWGVWMLNFIMFALTWSGLIAFAARFGGPPANSVPVKEYGFRKLPEEPAA